MAVAAEALRDSDRVNDGLIHTTKPLCAWIYGTVEVKTDKLDPGGREKASSDLILGCFILHYHPRLGPYSRIARRKLSQLSLSVLLKFLKDKSPSVIE